MKKRKKTYGIYLNEKKYNPIWIEEYKMMREELVIYMEKLQGIRNMLYIALGTIFVFSLSKDVHLFYTLLPLLIVLPSYVAAVNYWVCVRKASAYLVVFHESYDDCPIHWESRHNMLKKINPKKGNFKKSVFKNVPLQLIHYFVCALITLLNYALRLYEQIYKKLSMKTPPPFFEINIDGLPIVAYIIVGIFITLFLLVFFILFSKGKSYDMFLKEFLMIKNREIQNNIGKCWLNGVYEETNEYSEEINSLVNKFL